MKCPECQKENKKSTVRLGMCTTTLMYADPGYYDEDGNWVDIPNPNTTFQEYTCSNGHTWTESFKEK